MAEANLQGAHGVVDSAFALLDKAIDAVGEDAVSAYIYAAYVRYDVPYVPDAVEQTLLDPLMEQAIKYVVKRIHASVHKDPAPPAGAV